MDAATIQQIHQGRRNFAAMVVTYSLGVFNDGFFRQSAMLLAVAGDSQTRQGKIQAIFALPYLIFAPLAGWLADRFAKRHVVIGAKVLELAAMTFGALGICLGSTALILAMVFTMAMQSCLFSPALNGSIPELYPAVYVTRANAILKVVVTSMILAGIAAAGPALEIVGTGPGGVPTGYLTVAVVLVLVSMAGVFCSFGVPHRPAASPGARFPRHAHRQTLAELAAIGKDPLLSIAVISNVFIWSVGSLLIMLINRLAIQQFDYGRAVASYMSGVELIGLAAGGVVGSRLAVGRRWYRVLVPGVASLSAILMAMVAAPALPPEIRKVAIFTALGLVGFFGGMFMIPCEAFVQVRPAADHRGRVLASANFAVFFGILLSGPLEILLTGMLLPTQSMALVGAAGLVFAVWLRWTLRRRVRAVGEVSP